MMAASVMKELKEEALAGINFCELCQIPQKFPETLLTDTYTNSWHVISCQI